ncbi:MAG: thioredoxin family protein [Candidatus Peregrinibacteria bacterium]|nr:thioredoxin family protein [Candidatus Peregrinibacteria bacterium]
MALIESTAVTLESAAPSFSLQGVDDKQHSLADFQDANILVMIFMCNHCPYVQACIDRLITLQGEFSERGVRFIGINSNDSTDYPADSFEAMKIFSSERNMNFPYLFDETQDVARVYGAVCTPDIFVYDAERMLRYHGRIDNNWKDESKATTHELSDALAKMIEGEVPQEVQHPSMGCSIKWKQ